MKHNMRTLLCVMMSLFVPLVGAVDVDLGGQHRMRGLYSPADTTGQMSDMFIQRFKLTGSFRPNEMFESHFWMMTNHKWGNTEYDDSDVRIYGYGDWKVLDEVMVRLGRAPLQITDGSSMGVNDYENYPYIWNGVFVTYNTESVILDVWGAYLPKVWSGQTEVRKYERSVGMSVNVRALPDFFKTVNLFAVHTVGSEDVNTHMRVGLSLGGNHSMVDYKFSGAVHGQEFSSMNQHLMDFQLGYTVSNVHFYINHHRESDQFDPYYYTRHASAGLIDIATWGNGTGYSTMGVDYTPMDDFEMGVAALYFYSVGQFGQWHKPGYNVGKEKVWEVDVHLRKTYAGGFAIELYAGAFDAMGDSSHLQVQMNTSFDF